MGALWQRTVSEQARISGIDARQADEIVTRRAGATVAAIPGSLSWAMQG